jgi:hypothetical protein
MKIAGASGQVISEELGVERRTVYLWFSDPLVKREMDSQLRDISALLTERLVANAMRALDAIGDLLRQEVSGPVDAPTMLEVIREVLDRNPWTAKRDHGATPTGPARRYADLTDQELVDELNGLLGVRLRIMS